MNDAQGLRLALTELEARLRESASIEDFEEEDGSHRLLRFTSAFRQDCDRRTTRQVGTLSDRLELQQAIADGAELLDCARLYGGSDFVGWYHGCEARNRLQHIANVLSGGILQMSFSVMTIEKEHPNLQPSFNQERAERAERARAAETA